MVNVRYQIPQEDDPHHPTFVDVAAEHTPRVGDRVELESGIELNVDTVLWRGLDCRAALVILK